LMKTFSLINRHKKNRKVRCLKYVLFTKNKARNKRLFTTTKS
jgi:hypothetical protein